MKDIKFSFEDLNVYQKALDFIDNTYKTTENFPKKELFGLSSQFQRASVSIALNIAEGSGDTNAQFNRFLNISKGSIKECVVCSTIARRLKYISDEENKSIRQNLEELSKMTSGLQSYLTNHSNVSKPKTND
ncbi:four helix bundle protein [Psychroserpens sp. Hel_I_66]|uniref:four helix bundle protein n=1 Tax=Psychroserpens sp. Hel_I_66 TaxID=1250004 RepID=UPI000645C8BB|nr:four helix bundle protein [Psychroserpens sp. Hel_I_66]